MSERPRVTKIEVAISSIKADRAKIEREIVLLQRENERLFAVLSMLEKVENDKQLA